MALIEPNFPGSWRLQGSDLEEAHPKMRNTLKDHQLPLRISEVIQSM
jgi:hypothetical protein